MENGTDNLLNVAGESTDSATVGQAADTRGDGQASPSGPEVSPVSGSSESSGSGSVDEAVSSDEEDSVEGSLSVEEVADGDLLSEDEEESVTSGSPSDTSSSVVSGTEDSSDSSSEVTSLSGDFSVTGSNFYADGMVSQSDVVTVSGNEILIDSATITGMPEMVETMNSSNFLLSTIVFVLLVDFVVRHVQTSFRKVR